MEAESGNLVAGVSQWNKGITHLSDWIVSLTLLDGGGRHHCVRMLGKGNQ